jgi:hypothetical protein
MDEGSIKEEREERETRGASTGVDRIFSSNLKPS